MRMESYLCLGGIEISNGNRFLNYVRQFADRRFSVTACYTAGANVGGPGYEDEYEDEYQADPQIDQTIVGCCFCNALDSENDEMYLGPAADDAPWYDPSVPASEEFLGVFLGDVRLNTPIQRTIVPRFAAGSVIGAENLTHRLVQAKDSLMVATTPRGMAYGERWLTEALRGSLCRGECAGDLAEVLPSCPGTATIEDADPYFRRLVGVSLIDGPVFSQVQQLPECVIQFANFQLAAELPYLYGKSNLVNQGPITPGFPIAGIASTPTWPGDGVLVITVNPGASGATGIVIIGRVSLDSNCPPEHGGDPCFRYRVPSLAVEEQFVIDAMEQSAYIVDPASKTRRPALGRIGIPGNRLFTFPELAPCSDVCVTVSVETGDADVRIEWVPREL